MKNILLISNYHHKNLYFLKIFVKKYYKKVNNIEEADIILSPATSFPIHKYPKKKFIFGPHFGKGRINIVRKLNNIYNNAIYIQPSQPSVDLWVNELKFNTLPVKAIPFGVNTHKFSPNKDTKRTKVFLYYKDRNPAELHYLQQFLKARNIQYKIFHYHQRYAEENYLSYLKECKYGIWLGRHESQGFALEEALSCDVPLLVWNVKLRKEEWSSRERLKHIKSEVTTIPYWDERCGEFFYKNEDLEKIFEKFINRLDTYKPREYIVENVSMEACDKLWNKLISEL